MIGVISHLLTALVFLCVGCWMGHRRWMPTPLQQAAEGSKVEVDRVPEYDYETDPLTRAFDGEEEAEGVSTV